MNPELKELIAEHFKPIFQAYDKDQSSTLEKPQLRALLADNLGVTANDISQDQLDWHFSRIDENGDGKITFEEYVRFILIQFSHFFGDRAKKCMKDQKDTEN